MDNILTYVLICLVILVLTNHLFGQELDYDDWNACFD